MHNHEYERHPFLPEILKPFVFYSITSARGAEIKIQSLILVWSYFGIIYMQSARVLKADFKSIRCRITKIAKPTTGYIPWLCLLKPLVAYPFQTRPVVSAIVLIFPSDHEEMRVLV